MANVLAIVGRPNVGKSTLFNRLIEKKEAIMDNEPGVTRDRHYGYVEWNGRNFTVIDTGGYVEGSHDIFENAIRTQVKEALEEATAILFMVDCHTGVHGLDQDFANVVREIKKPVFVAANKADNPEKMMAAHEFYSLGLADEVFPVASSSGSGTGDLLDAIVKNFGKEKDEHEEELPKIAIVGRPNVGKSSFVNALLGRERSIVTDIAGTTRDAVNSRYQLFGKDFILTDTAGIRKKKMVKENIEFYAVLRAIRGLQDADVCIIMIDAMHGLQSQDMNIISLAHRYKKGIVLMVNKWDMIHKNNKTMDEYRMALEEKLGPICYAPIIFTSVLNRQRIMQTLELGLEVHKNRSRKIPTSKLNELVGKDLRDCPPPSIRGHYIKIKYITQLPILTPTFAFFCNFPQYIRDSYQRYLTNRIRHHFDFRGVPIKVIFRKK